MKRNWFWGMLPALLLTSTVALSAAAGGDAGSSARGPCVAGASRGGSAAQSGAPLLVSKAAAMATRMAIAARPSDVQRVKIPGMERPSRCFLSRNSIVYRGRPA